MATQRQKQKVQDAAMRLASAKAEYDKAQNDFDEAFKEATCGPRKQKENTSKTGSADLVPPVEEVAVATAMVKIEQVLASDQNKQFKYSEIAKLTELPIPSIKVFLNRLKKKGKASRVGWGLWQISQLNLPK